MSSITEQFSAATRSQLENQIVLLNTLASSAVASAEKLFALNLNTTRASVVQGSAAAKKLLEARGPQELFQLNQADTANFDQLFDYGRALYGIAASAQTELLQSAKDTLQKLTPFSAAVAPQVAPATIAAAKLAAVAKPAVAKAPAKAAEPAPVVEVAAVAVEIVSPAPAQAQLIEAEVVEVKELPAAKAAPKAKPASKAKK
ncbi:phasin family protein [Duganella qianjiadongensis]|uniref:TIGR01841 family phasin n=1 Tax=Duganella qianjiadongensis TaxID=2692176 RepID=A0ABW9VIY4_9BURK|nr:phasin family protein [Duganella qianjiadongensis]MYM38605.1 TIGR01841 family phasin [Duganella qianjiadongensis]